MLSKIKLRQILYLIETDAIFDIKELSVLKNSKQVKQANICVLQFGSRLTIKLTKFGSIFLFVKRKNIVEYHNRITTFIHHFLKQFLISFCLKTPTEIKLKLLNINFSAYSKFIKPFTLKKPFILLPHDEDSCSRYSKHLLDNLVLTVYHSGVITGVCNTFKNIDIFKAEIESQQ